MNVKLPKRIENRLREISVSFDEHYYRDKLEICNIIYDEDITSEGIFDKLNRYAAYRIYYYEPELLHEEVLGEEKMAQIRLLYELAKETI